LALGTSREEKLGDIYNLLFFEILNESSTLIEDFFRSIIIFLTKFDPSNTFGVVIKIFLNNKFKKGPNTDIILKITLFIGEGERFKYLENTPNIVIVITSLSREINESLPKLGIMLSEL